jgi:hypothetical protein
VTIKLISVLSYAIFTLKSHKFFFVGTFKFFIQVAMEVANLTLLILLAIVQSYFNKIYEKKEYSDALLQDFKDSGDSTAIAVIIFLIIGVIY